MDFRKDEGDGFSGLIILPPFSLVATTTAMKLRATTRVRLSRPRAGNMSRHAIHPVAPVPFSCSQATGVSDVNEVIQKMISQESTAESLMILTKENQVGRRQASPDCSN